MKLHLMSLNKVFALVLLAWLFLAVFPFLWMFLISFREPVDAFFNPLQLFPSFTLKHYYEIWVEGSFWVHSLNTLLVTIGTVTISMTTACFAGYALSRFRGSLGFWLLIVALVFRAMPYVVLLTSYQPAFLELGIWNRYETLIIVLVAINQPFTIWMLRAFFMGIPQELDEAAQVDGCTPFQTFYQVIVPVMWPGVITAGLFSVLLAYNDFMISSQLMNGDKMTMTAALANYMRADDDVQKLMQGIAGAVSICIPLIILIVIFQKRLVSGLVQGAIKG